METEIKKEEVKETSNEKEVKVKAFKVFNGDWTCQNFKYEVGKTYSVEGDPILCEYGFHSCTDLRDCFTYYPLARWSKFAEVEASGTIFHSETDSKIVSSKITIVKELYLNDIVKMIATNEYNDGKDKTKKNVIDSPATKGSKNIIHSEAISKSEGVNKSEAVYQSNGIQKSEGINYSEGISFSYGVSQSNGVYSGSGIYNSSCLHSSNGIDVSKIVARSYGLYNSSMIIYSYGLSNCELVSSSQGVHIGYGIEKSLGIYNSFGINSCKGINKSRFLDNCEGLSESLFCSDIKNKYFLFNKKVSEERFNEVNERIQKLTTDWTPEPNNGDELFSKYKETYEYRVSPALLTANSNMYINMPEELVKYIKSLPEYDEEIFNSIIYGKDKERVETEKKKEE